jgi:hypothetical protein
MLSRSGPPRSLAPLPKMSQGARDSEQPAEALVFRVSGEVRLGRLSGNGPRSDRSTSSGLSLDPSGRATPLLDSKAMQLLALYADFDINCAAE